ASAGLHHVQATSACKHINAYVIHARAMSWIHHLDNAAAIGGVRIKLTTRPLIAVTDTSYGLHRQINGGIYDE
ncbi:hypothetical protein, partial [Sphingobium sp. CECT 9361]|uniref:hypothetical protein n=1 Tax=Sphingobium sp. CECT 9361 TaxID=2845384 RepID=UPI001E5CFC57